MHKNGCRRPNGEVQQNDSSVVHGYSPENHRPSKNNARNATLYRTAPQTGDILEECSNLTFRCREAIQVSSLANALMCS
jgi:hypothetical protein